MRRPAVEADELVPDVLEVCPGLAGAEASEELHRSPDHTEQQLDLGEIATLRDEGPA